MNKKDTIKITIELKKDLARELELLANYYNTTSEKMLSHMVRHPIINEWAKIQLQEHPQNRKKMQAAKFKKGENYGN